MNNPRIPSPNREFSREGPREHDAIRDYQRPEEGERVRSRKGNQAVDPFYVPPELQARYPDLSFNWKNHEVYGKIDQADRRMIQDQGWRACPHSMFPGYFAPEGSPGPIIIQDMVLMERPMHLTVEARNEEIGRAYQNEAAHRQRASQAPAGQAPRMPMSMRSQTVSLEIPEE